MIPFIYFSPAQNLLFFALLLWTLVWKIYVVWLAARAGHKKWFVVLLVLNTLAILDIFYIFKIAKKSGAEVRADFKNALESFKI